MDSPEQSLVEAAKQDPARFAALYEAHFARIYAFVMGRVRDRGAAEDITADVFRHALAAIGSFQWRGVPFASWLYRIAANEIADWLNRRSRESVTIANDEPGEDEIDAIERRAALYALVKALPRDQRRVIELRFVEERSIRETAQTIGRSEGAVKQLQLRALQALRDRMGASHG
jgi:RNA polymerase sigma-70 factor, ECF subfamily